MGHSPPKNKVKTSKKRNYDIRNLQAKGEELNGNSSFILKKKKKMNIK